jgi:phage shock protein A
MVTARSQVAAMIAQEKELEADLNENKRLADEWGRKAQRAVEASKDDLAREALRRKRDTEENARVYGEQLAVQESAVTKLKEQLRQLESKYQTTLSQRDSLVARQRRARAQTQVAQSITVFSPLDPSSELDRMERRIRSDEAQAAAALELGESGYDAQFKELDMDIDIEDELAELKRLAGRASMPEIAAESTTTNS